MTSLAPPPEARLIGERRRSRVPRLSMRAAALQAGISPAYWRMVETGTRRVHGQDFPEHGSDDTVAAMAYVVGVTPAELHDCDRKGAAEALEVVLADPPSPDASLAAAVRGSRDLTEQQKQALIRRLRGD